MTIRTIRFQVGPEFTRADGEDGAWIVEGYASTDAVDSYNEIVEPEAFRRFLPKFKEFPVVLLNHNWFDVPIGKVVDAQIKERGLWVRTEISRAAAGAWQLIQDGILKAFSIGFRGVTLEEHLDGDEPDVWKEIELVEISVVNVPANREALFSVAESKGIDLSAFSQKSNHRKPITTKTEEGEMPDQVTLDQVKGEVAEQVKSLVPTMETAAKTAAEDAVKTSFEFHQKEGAAGLAEIRDAVQGCATKADLEAMTSKVMADVSAITAKAERLAAPGLGALDECLADGPVLDSKAAFYADLANETSSEPAYVRAMVNRPEDLTRNESEQELVKRLHQAHDEIVTLDALARAASPFSYRGPQTLKAFKPYSALVAQFRKAMDTATSGEGSEWVPIGYSADLIGRVEGALVVANKFRSFTQPTKTYTWPVKSTRGTAYLIGESKGDSAAKITASTPQTGNVTFTAKQLAMRVLTSSEFVEDSIVPVLPFIMDEIATTLARGVDDTTINGDTSGTHQDNNVTDGTDRRKAWSGLRYEAINGTSSTAATTSATVANLRTIWKLMLEFGGDPAQMHLFLAVRDYIQLMADSALTSVANFGERATIMTGTLLAVHGIAVSVSPFCQTNLNATGVYDGATTTKSAYLLVYKPSYMFGDRRLITLETDKDIETQQMIIVGTLRKDFQEIIGGQNPAVIGYNMA